MPFEEVSNKMYSCKPTMGFKPITFKLLIKMLHWVLSWRIHWEFLRWLTPAIVLQVYKMKIVWLTKLMLFIIFSRFGTEVGLYVKTGQPATCLAKVNIFSIENSGLNGIQTHIRLQSCTPPKGKFNYIVSHFRSRSITRYTWFLKL